MSRARTTDEQVHTAQTRYDDTNAESLRLSRELAAALAELGTPGSADKVVELTARSAVAIAEREYAWAVYVATREDQWTDLRVVS